MIMNQWNASAQRAQCTEILRAKQFLCLTFSLEELWQYGQSASKSKQRKRNARKITAKNSISLILPHKYGIIENHIMMESQTKLCMLRPVYGAHNITINVHSDAERQRKTMATEHTAAFQCMLSAELAHCQLLAVAIAACAHIFGQHEVLKRKNV